MRHLNKYRHKKLPHCTTYGHLEAHHRFSFSSAYIRLVGYTEGWVYFQYKYNNIYICLSYTMSGDSGMTFECGDYSCTQMSSVYDYSGPANSYLTNNFFVAEVNRHTNLGLCRWCGVYDEYYYDTQRDRCNDIHHLEDHVHKCKKNKASRVVPTEQIVNVLALRGRTTTRIKCIMQRFFRETHYK